VLQAVDQAVGEVKSMTKAKLIKKDEAIKRRKEQTAQKSQKQATKKTMIAVSEWIEGRRSERLDPRTAFAALFAWPQAQ
jgi:hypothetical protein